MGNPKHCSGDGCDFVDQIEDLLEKLNNSEKKRIIPFLKSYINKNTEKERERHKIARDCKHKWKPVRLEPASEYNRQPNLKDARCYVVCLECSSWSYYNLSWVGFYVV